MEILKNAKLICVSKHRAQDSFNSQVAFNKYILFFSCRTEMTYTYLKSRFLVRGRKKSGRNWQQESLIGALHPH